MTIDKKIAEGLRKLEKTVDEHRAQTGVEAAELRARVRELERRLEQLEKSPTAAVASQERPKKAQRAAVKQQARAARGSRQQAPGAMTDPEPSSRQTDDEDVNGSSAIPADELVDR
jgi:DNA-binding protein H-NS